MTRTLTPSPIRCSLVVLALVGATRAAVAQPADDPGLANPPPRGAQNGARGNVRESVQVTESEPVFIDAPDLYDRLAAPSIAGPVGLFRTLTGDVGLANSLRVGLNLQVFAADSFLVAGNSTLRPDSNTRLMGTLAIGYTPWKYLELYLGLLNSSNQNRRNDDMRTDPEVILALGDVTTGLKLRLPVARFIDLGLHLGVRFFNQVGAVDVKGVATSFTPDLIASFDLRRIPGLRHVVPLRFHLNFGYALDNSIKLLPDGQCASSTSNDACIRSRVVETFAYGIAASRFRIAVAVDAPITVKRVGIEPFAEYHAEVAVGDGDQTVVRGLGSDAKVSNSRLTNPAAQWLTFGLRVRPVSGLILEAGVDVGLQSIGFQYGPATPPWNVILGAAWAYDASARSTRVVTRTVTREGVAVPVEEGGRLRGVVRDAGSRRPIAGATVRYLNRRGNAQVSDDDGSFLSYHFAPGAITLEVGREDYQPVRVEATVPAGGETPLEVLLTAKPPQNAVLHGKVTDEAGAPVNAAVHLSGPGGATSDAAPEGPGGFGARVPAGEYAMDVIADGYLARQRMISLNPGQTTNVDVVLRKKPATSHVSLGKGEIVLKGTIHFGTNNAEIRPDGQQLIDEVADVLVKNPRIRRLRIEGHTDNRGTPAKNLQLSKARAQAVMTYLVKSGIDPLRLEAEGYGARQPLVPNITAANRARNRRVSFKILEESK